MNVRQRELLLALCATEGRGLVLCLARLCADETFNYFFTRMSGLDVYITLQLKREPREHVNTLSECTQQHSDMECWVIIACK